MQSVLDHHVIPLKSSSSRLFSTSYRRFTHYDTLGVMPDATKAQIKTSFYKLSKEHHPDVSDNPESEEAFRQASEAYAVLANDRARRAYDRTLREQRQLQLQQETPSNLGGDWRRKPAGATYAWARHPRDKNRTTYAQTAYAQPQDRPLYPNSPYTPYKYHTLNQTNDHGRPLTPSQKRMEAAYREHEKLEKISHLSRATTVFAFLALTLLFLEHYN